MANPHFSTTLTQFTSQVQKSKDRLVAIPAAEQKRLGLARRKDNHLISYSVRKAGGGRWNHLYAKLTYDNEFSIPSAVAAIAPGDRVDIKLHRVIRDVDALAPDPSSAETAGATLLALANVAGEDPREDGSERIDDELYSP